jgi:hypothetical protein
MVGWLTNCEMEKPWKDEEVVFENLKYTMTDLNRGSLYLGRDSNSVPAKYKSE